MSFPYFPYPRFDGDEMVDGSIYTWPSTCKLCRQECRSASSTDVGLCSFGYNHYRSGSVVVGGLVIRDYARSSPARRKLVRMYGPGPTMAEVLKLRTRIVSDDVAREADIAAAKEAVINQYVSSEAYKSEILERLKPQLRQMLAQVHDYKQFVSQVIQNVNVMLERQFPGIGIDAQLERAQHEEVAIYWAARLLEEKLTSALFLWEPERLDDESKKVRFRVHGCVVKYLKIYQRSFGRRNISVTMRGESYGEVLGNPAAFGVIPHTLIDNALKYSPNGGSVEVSFTEDQDSIELTVGSYGPRIRDDERSRIFDLFYRGEEARRSEPEGAGFGLHLCQLVAAKLGTKVVVEQDTQQRKSGKFWTEFSVKLNRA